MHTSVIRVLQATGLALLLRAAWTYVRQRTPLPPGPRGLPLLGNLLDIPKLGHNEWLQWATFKDKYGPVSSVHVMGKTIIVLNSLKACDDLLEQRSSIYSDRPVLPFAGQLIGWNRQMIFAPYNSATWKGMRKLMYNYAGSKSAIIPFQEVQEKEMKEFLVRVYRDPSGLLRYIRLGQGAMFLKLSHGYTIRKNGLDPLINVVEKAAQDFYIVINKVWLVDIFPWLRHTPLQYLFQRAAAKYRQTNIDQVDIPFNFVKQQLDAGSALCSPSFVSNNLPTSLNSADQETLKHAANALYGGGTDTLTAVLSVFFLAMVLYPEVQKKAQEEIDRVVGTHRLPTFADRERLPYLAAVYKEVLRWNIIGPMGIPHSAMKDDVYEGFFIPKDSIILQNLWSITNDPEYYETPREFRPERFYPATGDACDQDPRDYAFGFGRRRCPGQDLAEANIFLCMALSLSVFAFSNEVDKYGVERPPSIEFANGTVRHLKSFQCTIKPRTDDALAILQALENECTLTDDHASVL